MVDERAQQVARRAASLIPEPPAAHDAFGHLAWEELVVSTARRLQWLLDAATLLAPPQPAPSTGPGTPTRLDADTLLRLAVLLAHDDTDSACADLLAGAASF